MLRQKRPSRRRHPRLPRLLVSVRNVEEARLAIDEGVRLIDIKEPRKGSLGAATAASIQNVANLCGETVLLSVALGELLEIPQVNLPSDVEPTYVKCGLAGCGKKESWTDLWCRRMSQQPGSAVAVVYADWKTAGAPAPDAILRHAVETGCSTVLLDTFDKTGGPLLRHLTLEETYAWIAKVQQSGLAAVIAGSLDASLMVPLLTGGADCIAVRGAACRGGRSGTLDRDKLRTLVQQAASATAPQTDSITG